MVWSAAIGAGASLLGNIVGAKSARDANQANIAASREQMAFQERMRDTSYQSAVQDLRKAGLNPMLAYTQGGSAVPSGAQAVSNPEYDSGSGSGAVSSALAAVQMKNQADQVAAQVKNIEADTVVKLAQAGQVEQQTGLLSAQRTTESYRPQLIVDQARLADANSRQIDALMFDSLAKIRADTALSRTSAAQISSQNLLMKDLMSNETTRPFAPLLNILFR